MEETVTLEQLLTEIDALKADVASRGETIAALTAERDSLRAANASLAQLVARTSDSLARFSCEIRAALTPKGDA